MVGTRGKISVKVTNQQMKLQLMMSLSSERTMRAARNRKNPGSGKKRKAPRPFWNLSMGLTAKLSRTFGQAVSPQSRQRRTPRFVYDRYPSLNVWIGLRYAWRGVGSTIL